MIEIFLLVKLCKKNRSVARERGRNPLRFTLLTILLWFGFEFTGMFIAIAVEMPSEILAYTLMIALAGAGAALSYLITKNCKQKLSNEPDPMTMVDESVKNSPKLVSPAKVTVARVSSLAGAMSAWTYYLNGENIGTLEDGQSLSVFSDRSHNVLGARSTIGKTVEPYVFDVTDGEMHEIGFGLYGFEPKT